MKAIAAEHCLTLCSVWYIGAVSSTADMLSSCLKSSSICYADCAIPRLCGSGDRSGPPGDVCLLSPTPQTLLTHLTKVCGELYRSRYARSVDSSGLPTALADNMLALAMYEHAITLGREITFIWSKNTPLRIKLLYSINRYVVLAYSILGFWSSFVPTVSRPLFASYSRY